MNKLKAFSPAAILISISLVITACSTGGNKTLHEDVHTSKTATVSDIQEDWKLGREPLTFSFYVNYDWYAPKGFGNTQATHWLQEKMKVTVEEIPSNGNAAQKLGAMIASGDLPDVIQLNRGSQFELLAGSGRLVTLDDYINDPQYINYKKLVDPEAVRLTNINGKIYGMLNWFGNRNGISMSGNGWILNRKIYKELGSPNIETFEDLYAYLLSVRREYPEIIPLDTSNTNTGVVQVQNFIYCGFGENRWMEWAKSDGMFAVPEMQKKEFSSIFRDPAFKESYILTSRLFREKLLTQDALTQKLEQFKEKLNDGRIALAAVYDASKHGEEANNVLRASDEEAGYDYIPFIYKKGVDIDKIVMEVRDSIGWNVNCITTKAREPERIFSFFDWMLSDDGIRFHCFGPQGELWDIIDQNGAPIPNERYINMSMDERNALRIGEWVPQGSWRIYDIKVARSQQNPEMQVWGDKASLFFGRWVKYIGNELNGTAEDPAPNSSGEDVWKKIKRINEIFVPRVIFSGSDGEAERMVQLWEKEVNAAGYDKLLQYRTELWRENIKKIVEGR